MSYKNIVPQYNYTLHNQTHMKTCYCQVATIIPRLNQVLQRGQQVRHHGSKYYSIKSSVRRTRKFWKNPKHFQ